MRYVRPTNTIVDPILYLLESFYELQPISVAFVGSAKHGAAFGGPLSAHTSSHFEGFSQWHSDTQGLSVYTSYFGWGKVLVAEFEFQHEYPPPTRQWLAFVRLAALIQHYLDSPTDFPQLPLGGVPVREPKPSGPRPRWLSAEAPFE